MMTPTAGTGTVVLMVRDDLVEPEFTEAGIATLMMNGQIVAMEGQWEWRCLREEGGGVCTDEWSRDTHSQAERHQLCQWVVVLSEKEAAK